MWCQLGLPSKGHYLGSSSNSGVQLWDPILGSRSGVQFRGPISGDQFWGPVLGSIFGVQFLGSIFGVEFWGPVLGLVFGVQVWLHLWGRFLGFK